MFIHTASAPSPTYPHLTLAGVASGPISQQPAVPWDSGSQNVVSTGQTPWELLVMQMLRCNPSPADPKGPGPSTYVVTSPSGGSSTHSLLRTSPAQARQASREEEGVVPAVSLQPRSCSLPRRSDAISSANYNSKSRPAPASPGPGVPFQAERSS